VRVRKIIRPYFFTALLGFNIMGRFLTQEDILKQIDEENYEFVDITSGAESEDDEEIFR
jgi:hypothetical protein